MTPDKVRGLADVANLFGTHAIRVILAKPAREIGEYEVELVNEALVRNDLMARPCPVEPRHGFVPSRVLQSGNEILDLAKEVVKEEENAWIMVNPYIQARYNAVMTQNMTAIGLGHDGATAGRRTVSLPLALKFVEDLHGKCLEVVGDANRRGFPMVVQSKSVDSSITRIDTDDFIPETLIVGDIIDAARYTDLEWERFVTTFNPLIEAKCAFREFPKYAVAYMPGASLLSHKALWCVSHNIPFITSKLPKIGDVLQRRGPELVCPAPSKVRLLLDYGFNKVFQEEVPLPTILRAAIHCVHHSYRLMMSVDGAYVVTYGLAALAKLMLAACIAELRYAAMGDVIDGGASLADFPWISLFHRDDGPNYRNMFCREFYFGPGMNTVAHRIAKAFSNLPWISVSYGGKAWADIAIQTAWLIDALFDGDIKYAIHVANKLISMEHNNSLAIDKYFSSEAHNELSNIVSGDWSTAIRALPGLAAFCKPILTWCADDEANSLDERSPLRNVGGAVLNSYYCYGAGPVISGQVLVVRNAELVESRLWYMFCNTLDSGGLHVSMTLLDALGREIEKKDCKNESGWSVGRDAEWALIEVKADNPAAYHMSNEIGIVLEGEWFGYSAEVSGAATYHLAGERNGVPVIIAAPGECSEFYSRSREANVDQYRHAIELGFGFNFDNVRMPTAYSSAFDIVVRGVHHKRTVLYGIALGMTLRYLFAMALWVEQQYTGCNRLDGILDIRQGFPGVSLVSTDKLLDAALGCDIEVEYERCLVPIANVNLAHNVSAMQIALDLLKHMRGGCIIDPFDVRHLINWLGLVRDSGVLCMRTFWDPWRRMTFAIDLRQIHLAKRRQINDYVLLHPSDLVHGLIMIREAIIAHGEKLYG